MFGSRPSCQRIEGVVPFDVFKPGVAVGLRMVKVHRGVLGFVFTESPDPAPHSNPVTALEKEGHMQ